MAATRSIPTMLTTTVGVLLGAAVGTLIGWGGANAAASSSATDGAGYGGTAGTLQVLVQGEVVHVTGSGFLAAAPVTVTVGGRSAVVVADEFGQVDTLVTGDGSAPVTATGSTPTGDVTTLQPRAIEPSASSAAAMVGAGIGAMPALVRARRRRGIT